LALIGGAVQPAPVAVLQSASEAAASVSNWMLGYAWPLVNGPIYRNYVGKLLLPFGQSGM